MYVCSMTSAPLANLNDQRSRATRRLLVDATIACLVDVGYSRTSGVEICRRAGLTRGALNHHYPDQADLFVDALRAVYDMLLQTDTSAATEPRGFVDYVRKGFERVVQPEYKAVIELWLASRNDSVFGGRLADAIAEGSALFEPQNVLTNVPEAQQTHVFATYRCIQESLIGIGLGRAVSGGNEMAHEQAVLGVLQTMAHAIDVQLELST